MKIHYTGQKRYVFCRGGHLVPLGLWVASYFQVIIHYFLLTFWNKVPRITQFARIVRGLDDFLTTFLQNEDKKVQRLPRAWFNILLNWYFSSMESNRSKYKIYHRNYGKSGEIVAIIVIISVNTHSFKIRHNFCLCTVSFVRSFYSTEEWMLGTIHVTYFEIATWKVYRVSWRIPCMSWFDSLKRKVKWNLFENKIFYCYYYYYHYHYHSTGTDTGTGTGAATATATTTALVLVLVLILLHYYYYYYYYCYYYLSFRPSI